MIETAILLASGSAAGYPYTECNGNCSISQDTVPVVGQKNMLCHSIAILLSSIVTLNQKVDQWIAGRSMQFGRRAPR